MRRRDEEPSEGELAEDLNVAVLEPSRETLSSRRRRAALSEVLDELYDLVSDIDDE